MAASSSSLSFFAERKAPGHPKKDAMRFGNRVNSGCSTETAAHLGSNPGRPILRSKNGRD